MGLPAHKTKARSATGGKKTLKDAPTSTARSEKKNNADAKGELKSDRTKSVPKAMSLTLNAKSNGTASKALKPSKADAAKADAAKTDMKSNGVKSDTVKAVKAGGTATGDTVKRQMILSGNIKGIFCEICGAVTKMTLVGEWHPSGKPREEEELLPSKKAAKAKLPEPDEPETEDNKYWFKCPTCMQVQLIDEWRVQVEREKNLADLRKEEGMVYAPNGIYAVGDTLYHAALNEVGIVRSKQSTASGASSITVEFQTLGKRQLLENVMTDAERAKLRKKSKSKLKVSKPAPEE